MYSLLEGLDMMAEIERLTKARLPITLEHLYLTLDAINKARLLQYKTNQISYELYSILHVYTGDMSGLLELCEHVPMMIS